MSCRVWVRHDTRNASHSRTENENKSFRRLSGGTNLLVGDYENVNYKDFRYINN